MMDGRILKNAVIAGAAAIINQKHAVDELNVYPVPDGDTGTNMSMTMTAAMKQLQNTDDNNTVAKISDITAGALLRGARGNSGVILSLLFRGISKGLVNLKTAENEHLAHALDLGVAAAYKAVMQPTEGTILTVARIAAQKAKAISHQKLELAVFWEEVCKEAEIALANTPNQLPVLKKAGVVDAGGKGLCVIFRGMLAVFQGKTVTLKAEVEKVNSSPVKSTLTAVGDNDEPINFTYCTEFLVNKKTENTTDSTALRAYLESIGDCVVVVDDTDIIKVHVHTDHPGNALEKALTFGMLTNLKIENMRQQHSDRVKEAETIRRTESAPVPIEKKFGFVAVSAGRGITAMFNDAGVDVVVTGGQTMNPSTDDILDAIHATPAEVVFVLPNNKNIIMAAEQAVSLANGRKVCVLQTRTIPQGLSAMMAFDESADLNTNRLAMTKAFEKVATGNVTYAARDSEYEGHQIKKGEIIALANGKLTFTSTDVTKATYKLARKLIKSDSSFVTLIYGSDVTDQNAEYLLSALEKKFGSKIEFLLVNGGQPVYYYIISVE